MDCQDSISTFSGLEPLNQISLLASCSQSFRPFDEGYDLSENEGTNFGEGDVKEEGTGDSVVVMNSSIVAMVTDSRLKFFESKRPYNAVGQYCWCH